MMYTNTKHYLPKFINTIGEDETYHGIWWLPSDPEDKVSGVLYLRKIGGARLNLIGVFKNDFIHGPDHDFKDHEVILGQIVPGGHVITLVDCKEYEWKSPMFSVSNDTSVQKFRIEYVVFSVHSLTPPVFKGFEFSTTYLLDWVDPNLVNSNFDFKKPKLDGNDPQEISMAYGKAVIKINAWVNPNFNRHKEALPQKASITVELKEEITINHFIEEYQTPIINFVQFATAHLNSVTFINAFRSDSKDSVRIVCTSDFDQIVHSSESIVHKILFRMTDLNEFTPEFLINWLNAHSTFQHVFDLYFGSLIVKNQFPILKFLSLIQAIESFHYERGSTQEINVIRDSFNQKRDEVLDLIKDIKHKDWLKANLCYHTELRTRLKELYTEAKDCFTELIQDSERFIKKIVESRNYYTHYNPKLKSKAVTGDELFALIYTLRVWLDFHLMKKCGLPVDRCTETILKNDFYDSIKGLLKEKKYW